MVVWVAGGKKEDFWCQKRSPGVQRGGSRGRRWPVRRSEQPGGAGTWAGDPREQRTAGRARCRRAVDSAGCGSAQWRAWHRTRRLFGRCAAMWARSRSARAATRANRAGCPQRGDLRGPTVQTARDSTRTAGPRRPGARRRTREWTRGGTSGRARGRARGRWPTSTRSRGDLSTVPAVEVAVVRRVRAPAVRHRRGMAW